MVGSRDLKADQNPAIAPIPYITTDLPPGRTAAALCEAIWIGFSKMLVVDLLACETLS